MRSDSSHNQTIRLKTDLKLQELILSFL